MARNGIEKLKVSDLRTKRAGLLADGGNLYLRTCIGADGNISRGWIFRYQLSGAKPRDMGLGSLGSIGLGKPRELAGEYRELLATGIDPIAHRNHARAQTAAIQHVPTFDEMAKQYIAAHRPSWRSVVHAKQWETTLEAYASPFLGKLPVNTINTDHVMKVLEPIWQEKTDTAKRVRGRIEAVLNYATVRKLRQGDNPARWSGYLSELLARPSRLAPVQHHAALDYRTMGTFMAQLRAREGVAALALEFTVLTCARTGEIRATWDEIDLDERVWIVPGHRIKAGKEHCVPLSKAALAAAARGASDQRQDRRHSGAEQVCFSDDCKGARLSSNALLALLRRMQRPDVTVTDFARRSAIGSGRRPISRMTPPNWRWRTRSRTRWKRPIAGAACSTSDA